MAVLATAGWYLPIGAATAFAAILFALAGIVGLYRRFFKRP